MEITEREKELICHMIQKLRLDAACDAFAEAYPSDNSESTKAKVSEIADLMERLKTAGYGIKKADTK